MADVATQPVGDPTAVSTPATGLTADQQSAKGIITAALSQMGLGSLADWAWTRYLQVGDENQVFLELRGTPEYQTRFPAMEALAKQGNAITEAQYINYEQGVRQALNAHGIPVDGTFDSPQDIASYLIGNVSLAEVDRRLQKAQESAYQSPPEVRDEFTRLYGLDGPGLSTAYWLDPTKADPLLEKQYTSAQIAAQARIAKFGPIDRGQAERLAELGVTSDVAQRGFSSLAGLGDITGTTQAGEQALTQQQLLDAQFGGDAQAQAAIQARQQRRLAQFQESGQFAAGNKGVAGAGSAQGA